MKVFFVYVGSLKYRGRLLKQIKTLQDAGKECLLIHGRTESELPDYSVYDFPVLSLRVVRGSGAIAEKLKMPTLMVGLQFFSRKAADLIEEQGADAVVCVAMLGAMAGVVAKRRNPSLRYIFDSSELFLEACSGIKRSILARAQKRILECADVIIHAERRRLEYFHRTYKTEAEPFVLENLPYLQQKPPAPKRESGPIRCVYVGGFMPGRCCEEMLHAFSGLERSDVTFDMIGFYVNQSYQRVIESVLGRTGTERISILPPVSHSEMLGVLSTYDIGIAFYENTNLNNYYCAPNKVYDYIQVGIPVIANDYPGLLDVIRDKRVGACVPAIETASIGDAIDLIEREDMYRNITEDVRRRYSWQHQAEGYVRLFE